MVNSEQHFLGTTFSAGRELVLVARDVIKILFYFHIINMGFSISNLFKVFTPIMEIKTITLAGVNCFLLKSGELFFMVDSGFGSKRKELASVLDHESIRPGAIKLLILTHADADHAGNCNYLRQKYGIKIAMHQHEIEAGVSGDSRKVRMIKGNFMGITTRIILSLFILKKTDRFSPDLIVSDGYDLSKYGFDAKVIHLPGHTNGSIAILTNEGEFICGDLFMNNKNIVAGFGIDKSALKANIEKLKMLPIRTIYPGHGMPFTIKQLLKSEVFENRFDNDK